MLVGAMIAVAWSACPAPYGEIRAVRLEYAEGFTGVSPQGHELIVDLVTPLVGDEMAEVRVSAYFPYGEREPDGTNGITVAQARVDAIRQAVVDLGMASGLVGTSISAVGWGSDAVASTTVDLDVRVKTECHPLADLARRTNPYD